MNILTKAYVLKMKYLFQNHFYMEIIETYSPLSFGIDSLLRKWKTSDILFKQFVRE